MPLKFEKTCRCIKNVKFVDDNNIEHEFLQGREYQVDIELTISDTVHIVYISGDWVPFMKIDSAKEFNEYFELIE